MDRLAWWHRWPWGAAVGLEVRMTMGVVAAVAIAIAWSGVGGCDRGASQEDAPDIGPPNIVVIVLDAASAAYFGAYGAAGDSTPHIDRLARESVLFENAYSQSATTIPSTASLLTGVRGTTHLMSGDTVLPREYPTAAELLGRYGYRGFGVIGNPFAGAPALGFARGYEECVQVYALRKLQAVRAAEKSSHFRVTLPEDINEQVFRLLPRFGTRGSFAYIHYLQPHKPYDPPAEYLSGAATESGHQSPPAGASWNELHAAFLRANQTGEASPSTVAELETRYRANLRYVDAGVGALLDRLRREGWYDESVIVLMADHGDAFFKHGRFGHNLTLYDDMLRIPFVIKFPRRDGIAPRRLDDPVETIDLLPTLFDYLGLRIPEHLEGDSLWPLIQGRVRRLDGPEVVVATMRRNLHAIRLGDHKYLLQVQGEEELYDLRADPDEQRNRIEEEPAKARALRQKLESMVDLTARRTLNERHDLRMDPEMERLLEILGYAGEEAAFDSQ
jgi:arylsulfatase A-like enzyme